MCGWCVRRTRPRKQPTPRCCRSCGRIALHAGLGQCHACYQRDPARLPKWVDGAVERLGDSAPRWFEPLCHDLIERCSTSVALGHLRRVERTITAGIIAPAMVISALRTDGRSPGATARLVDEFFERRGLGPFLDEATRTAVGRRHRRLARFDPRMRPAAQAFAQNLLDGQRRAQLHGRGRLADQTIEARLADLAILAKQLNDRGINDWSAVTTADVERFIIANTGSRLASARSFFAFAKHRKLILIDPTVGIERSRAKGFTGHTLTRDEQRTLLRRWSSPAADPIERVVGLLCLLHGASGSELRTLSVDDINVGAGLIRLGRRAHPVPVDPITAGALIDCLAARSGVVTTNRHLIITKLTRSHDGPCSQYVMSRLLDEAGVKPSRLRYTRLADLAHRLDPHLTAIALGMTDEGALHYVNDTVDNEELHFAADL